MSESVPLLADAASLRALAAERHRATPCPACAGLSCAGWEALSATFEQTKLQRIATLRDPAVEDPTLEEHHPQGTRSWSADAPVVPGWFPYNRCDIWACTGCGRPFLRYTEYGGYYVEERIRELVPDRVLEAPQRA